MPIQPIKTTSHLILALVTAVAVLPACGGGAEPNVDGPPTESGQIRVTNRAARACDALVEAVGGRVVSADFEESAAGRAISEGDRAGLSLVSKSGDALPEVAGTIRFTGELRILATTCYGAEGEALAGDGLSL